MGCKIRRLDSDSEYVSEYVSLRNKYHHELKTCPVSVSGTKLWLEQKNIHVFYVKKDYRLFGAVVLNSDSGELTVFHDGTESGVGKTLISVAESFARICALSKVWAWCGEDNEKSRKMFERNGYESGVHFQKKLG